MAIPEWIHLSKTTGASEVFTNITISADTNTGTTSRSYTLTVTGGTPGDIASATIEVTQAGQPTWDEKYLTFNITSPGTINWYQSRGSNQETMIDGIDYRKNGGTWITIAPAAKGQTITEVIDVVSGDTLEFRGVNNQYSLYGGGTTFYTCNFSASTAGFNVAGNIMSMIYGDSFEGQTTLSGYMNFELFFIKCTGLTSAENLILPATTLRAQCYEGMFDGCTSLTTSPTLRATQLALYSYASMFSGCTSLSKIVCPGAYTTTNSPFSHWVSGVGASGTFYRNPNYNWQIGENGIPSGWTVIDAYVNA